MTRFALLVLAAFALLVRGGAMLAMPDTLRDDVDRYRAVAESVLQYGTFGNEGTPTGYRPALYPLLLVPAVALGEWSRAGIAALHLALGVGTVLLTLSLGRHAGLGHWAVAAAALVACDPLLMRQSTLIMTETPAAFLAVLGLAALAWAAQSPSPARAAAAGACLALAALCRPTFLPWLALSGLALAWLAGRSSPGRRAGDAPCARTSGIGPCLAVLLAFVLSAAALLSPWAVRNHLQFGRPIVSTTHGGYNLLLANNPYFYQHLRTAAWGTPWWSDELDREWLAERPGDEVQADRLAYQKARRHIGDEPAMFAWSCVVRVGRLFSPFPHQLSPDEGRAARWARYAVTVWYLAGLPLAVLGAATVPWRRSWLWAGLLVACFTAIHALYWTDLRMRAPLVPVLALLAAAGMARLASSRAGSERGTG